ncbi:MAG TPA: TonB-dependent receptor [Ferruginibacter sp.]|nr:TonB-dependent receptor [Ferruginibacter sp.]HMP20636.1 TonB-dependent receptor [Ferruginibacter sp.]
MAQDKSITGSIKDAAGKPLPGATVTVKGSPKISTVAEADGNFKLNVPAAARVLLVSYVGYVTKELPIGNKSSLSVVLQVDNSSLEEVVVIGYGTQKRGDVNGAISSVTAKEIANIPQPTVDQMLQGRAAGVTVTANSGQPGSAISVRIRGITRFGSSEPLYVIDGVLIDGNAPSQASSNHPVFGGLSPVTQEQKPSVLASINPNDIESIDVLKDASASAIYGSRAANGVVIITTKKGKAGDARLNYDAYVGFQEQPRFMDMMNLGQYAAFQNKLSDLFNTTPRFEFADPSKLGPGTNWQDAVFRRAMQQSHTLSISGANAKTDYYISGGYFKQEGTIIGSKFDRISLHTSVNSQAKDWLKVGTSLTANRNNTSTVLGNNYGIVWSALLQAPDVPIYNADGSFAGPALDPGGQPMGLRDNPLQRAMTVTNTLERSNIQGRVYGDIKLFKHFTLHSELNGSFNWGQGKIFNPTYSVGAPGLPPAQSVTIATLLQNNTHDSYWGWVQHLNYNNTFGDKHNVFAQIGREVWLSEYGGITASTSGFTAGNTIQTLNLGTQANNLLDEPKGSTSMESYMARLIYTFDNRYSITATVRRDRSSNFAEGRQVGYFPGVAASWKVSEEKFMEGLNRSVSNLKVRVGYGTTGNSSIPQYSYGSAIFPVNTGLGTGFRVGNFSNPDLTWETAIQQNLGIDFGLLNNRISVTFDIYKKNSKNFLFQQPLPSFLSGGTAEYSNVAVVQPPWVNAGEIENKGFEFTINTRNINRKDFTWNSTLIFSRYKNRVVSLNGFPELNGVISTGFGPQVFATKTAPGGAIGDFYGYRVQGIISTQKDLENLILSPQNVLGFPQTVSSDRSLNSAIYLGDILYAGNNGGLPNTQYYLGSPNPDFTYSITNNFTYKNFDLSIFLNGSYGGKILNALNFQAMGMYGLYLNQRAEAADFWTPQNPNSTIPAPRAGWGNNNLVMSDRFLESASYLRIQNVRFGYSLPAKWASKAKLRQLKLYFSGQNLHVFTKYSGLDPEVGSLNQNPILSNIDYGRYPTPRTITFGINAEF